jgi:dTDP-4-dehydrorhamnose 3,5-epimerase
MRPDSPTRHRWHGVTLSSDKLNALWIPPGFAHGFLTLTDNALVQYGLNGTYSPEHARGARWNDPAFAITWPGEPAVMNERDAGYAWV